MCTQPKHTGTVLAAMDVGLGMQAWGVLEHRAGNLDRARDLFQQGVWAQPKDRDVALVWQAWGYLEAKAGNVTLARQLYKCAVKADPNSEASWLVSHFWPFLWDVF